MVAAKKIISVVGARPHFIKAAPLIAELNKAGKEVLTIHTGQHYDVNMSDIFFRQLKMERADINLGVGSGSHAEQTASVLNSIEPILRAEDPEAVIVYGDTNSTLAAALAAAKLYIPLVHIEAGVRCGNRRMPEEINRKAIDHMSDYLVCPSELAVSHLEREGIVDGVLNLGDFMYDTYAVASELVESESIMPASFSVAPGQKFALCTLHREATTSDPQKLNELLNYLGNQSVHVVLPMHPRTSAVLSAANFSCGSRGSLSVLEPLGYLEMMFLLSKASLVLTDSGGLQKEAYWAGVPCITLMDETTWTETIDAGWNVLTGLDQDRISAAIASFEDGSLGGGRKRPDVYGKPGSAARLCSLMGWV